MSKKKEQAAAPWTPEAYEGLTGRAELVERMKPVAGSRAGSKRLINKLFAEITSILATGKEVQIPSFGRFHLVEKSGFTKWNYLAQKEITVPDRKKIAFKKSVKLRIAEDIVNNVKTSK